MNFEGKWNHDKLINFYLESNLTKDMLIGNEEIKVLNLHKKI